MGLKNRKVQILVNDEWKDVNFRDLVTGNKFRMFEPDGTPVVDGKRDTEFVAISDAYEISDTWGIGIR